MQNLIEFCRQVEIEVIHVKEEFTSDRTTWLPSHVLRGYALCMKGTRAAEIVPFATPKSGEKVFTKTTYDPFYSTGLKDYLLTRGKKRVLVAGLVTSVCVLLTAASAFQCGFLVNLIHDCCVDQPEYHHFVLKRFEMRLSTTNLTGIRGGCGP
eukprot:TRINITY_DN472_c0_g1_i8.p1 TRINITY_DN472_c0_g1~~TRINITY_DN472_c0_g1_i8.p1  ORF type:complete len:153 (+),score=11.62 TRINITY_DN472_c0_g1_i8:66-524(+)